MPAGRPAKSARTKILTGNPGKRKIRKRQVQVAGGAPKCPSWLPKLAKAEWNRIAKILEPAGRLTHADLAALCSYCTAMAELQEATQVLEKEGRTFTTEKGYTGQHPAVGMQRSAWSALKTFAALFGLDPSSRSRLPPPPDKKDEDPFDAFVGKSSE